MPSPDRAVDRMLRDWKDDIEHQSRSAALPTREELLRKASRTRHEQSRGLKRFLAEANRVLTNFLRLSRW